MEAKLIKIDRNGSKHYEGAIVCDRCGGKGYYAIGVHNMQPVLSPHDGGVCWKCFGAGKVHGKWIERTPEYQAKLDAKRAAKREAEEARLAAERAEREEAERAEREAEEARRAAEKARSQFVGSVGDKLDIPCTYVRSGSWEQPAYRGWGMTTMYAHIFRDGSGNVLLWKTERSLPFDPDTAVIVKGAVKDHTTYRDERQTVLTRCKVTAAE